MVCVCVCMNTMYGLYCLSSSNKVHFYFFFHCNPTISFLNTFRLWNFNHIIHNFFLSFTKEPYIQSWRDFGFWCHSFFVLFCLYCQLFFIYWQLNTLESINLMTKKKEAEKKIFYPTIQYDVIVSIAYATSAATVGWWLFPFFQAFFPRWFQHNR